MNTCLWHSRRIDIENLLEASMLGDQQMKGRSTIGKASWRLALGMLWSLRIGPWSIVCKHGRLKWCTGNQWPAFLILKSTLSQPLHRLIPHIAILARARLRLYLMIKVISKYSKSAHNWSVDNVSSFNIIGPRGLLASLQFWLFYSRLLVRFKPAHTWIKLKIHWPHRPQASIMCKIESTRRRVSGP